MSGLDTSVFDTSKMTITEDVAKAFTDDAVVHIKYREGLGNISEPNFLAGVTEGQEQVLVKGSRRVDIQKQLETKIHGNEIRQVDEGRRTVISKTVRPAFTARTTDGPSDATEYLEVQGGRETVITKYDDKTVKGNEIWTVMGACFKTIHGGEMDNDVTKFFERGEDKFTYGIFSGSVQMGKVEASGMKLELNAAAFCFDLLRGDLHGVHSPLEGLQTKLQGFFSQLGLHCGCPPCLGMG